MNEKGRSHKPYELGERTALFGEAVVRLCQPVRVTPVTGVLVRQAVQAATSVGANYIEADDADTRKDFRYKIGLCKRESRESGLWLRHLLIAVPEIECDLLSLQAEARESTLSFAAIHRSCSAGERVPDMGRE